MTEYTTNQFPGNISEIQKQETVSRDLKQQTITSADLHSIVDPDKYNVLTDPNNLLAYTDPFLNSPNNSELINKLKQRYNDKTINKDSKYIDYDSSKNYNYIDTKGPNNIQWNRYLECNDYMTKNKYDILQDINDLNSLKDTSLNQRSCSMQMLRDQKLIDSQYINPGLDDYIAIACLVLLALNIFI